MYKFIALAVLLALGGCLTGCLTGPREQDPLSAHLGPYYGGFDTALTPDPGDDLNPNECVRSAEGPSCESVHGNPLSHLLMKLDLNDQGQLTMAFYRTSSDYEADKPMYLSAGCRTSIGPAREYELHRIDEAVDETQLLATASFPLEFGNPILACTNSARFSSKATPTLDLALQVNPVSGASAISITLEKSRRDGDYLYLKKDGEKVPVKLDLSYAKSQGSETHRLCAADDKTLLENKDGYQAVCVMTGRKKWRIVLPLSPWGPGVTAFWGSTRSPKWYRTSGEPDLVTYHQAVFVPVQFEAGDDAPPD